ncbi:MAG: ABC transporter ATP-binding protein [Candidatus Thermoplasmatota archaeon]|jgi:ABC-2 type transport system ATP-binding protein|nr:ABC transporter ATP-binding protein [Candidatus Thermoplasmatota archaeon]MCL5963332.1 ABC transporter ATP-binding protein [Candidatus Thermoplasmatota archaeon]
MIKIKNLTKYFKKNGKAAVSSLDLTINDGEITGFAGLNGAGKTTTIRMIAGVTLPSSGTVTVDGADIVHDKVKASKSIGWVPELPNFEPQAKSISLMIYYAGFYGIDYKTAKNRAIEILKEVNIYDARKMKLINYSQGMKKRFSLASCMIIEPQNFLFDEILNGLDPEGIQFMRNYMKELKKKNKAVFLSTHILSELQNLADKVAIINNGKLVTIIKPDELENVTKSTITIKIKNIDDKIMNILQPYGKAKVEGGEIVLTDIQKDFSDLNTLLVKNNYIVTGFSVEGESLEDYFFKLIGGDNKK